MQYTPIFYLKPQIGVSVHHIHNLILCEEEQFQKEMEVFSCITVFSYKAVGLNPTLG